jgi:hypothetical protein
MAPRNALAAQPVFADTSNPLMASAPTPADAYSYNAPVLADALRTAQNPQFWQDAAQQYGNALLMGTTAPAESAMIRAFHGSPHSFDQFKSSAIGTGEGAQAYGHGLYFAQNEGVAQGYRDALAGKANTQLEWNGQPVPSGKPFFDLVNSVGADDWRLGKIIEQAGKYGPRSALETFEPHTRNTSDGAAWQAAMDKFQGGIGDSAKGHMYEVGINADPAHFLDWDKPMSEQSDHVVNTAADLAAVRGIPMGNATGARAYQTFAEHFGDPAQAAAALQQAGIPGIRYLDAGSRSQGEGTSNYVVFNPDTIAILRKYGIAGLIGGSTAASQMGGQQETAQ